jgi:hypothetical protein
MAEVQMDVTQEAADRWRVNGAQGWGVGVDFPSEAAALTVARTIERAARGETDPLLTIHRDLYPERYPYNARHEFWDGFDPEHGDEAEFKAERDVYEWDSGTIEWVAERIERALKGHPDLRRATRV